MHSSHASKTQDLAIKRETLASYIDLLVAAKVLYRPFRNVRDSWPCYLLTLDPLPEGKGGVRHLNLMEMMARDDDLGREA